jgi:molybdopterin-binding protein
MKLQYLKVFTRVLLVTSFSVMAGSTMGSQTTPESEALIDDMVKQIVSTMSAVADAEKKAGNDINNLHIELDIPSSKSPNLGLVLDINDAQGYKVMSVSPGSLADNLQITTGNIITAINGVNTKDDTQRLAFLELENTLPGDTITLQINKQGTMSSVEAIVEGQYTPSIKLEIGDTSIVTNNTTSQIIDELDETACGKVSVFFKPPFTRNLHYATVTRINERNVNSERESFRLPPGKHTVYLHEMIEDSMFTRRSRSLQTAKTLEIDVKANTTYYLAAKFIRKNRSEQRNGGYWEPVVWKTRENSTCKL